MVMPVNELCCQMQLFLQCGMEKIIFTLLRCLCTEVPSDRILKTSFEFFATHIAFHYISRDISEEKISYSFCHGQAY